ncbi:MAG: hypothetical protein ACE5E9_07945 [Nitrospinaceae bacterium]
MKRVRTRDLKEGMVPEKDVRDRSGRLILASGQVITARHIRTFKAWGVTDVEVETPSSEDSGEISADRDVPAPPVPEKVKEEIENLFRFTDKSHPAMAELVDLCTLRKMESQKEKEPDNGA